MLTDRNESFFFDMVQVFVLDPIIFGNLYKKDEISDNSFFSFSFKAINNGKIVF